MYIDIMSVKVPETKPETIVGNENIYDSLLDLSDNIIGLETITLNNTDIEAYMVANEQKINFIKIVEKDVEVGNEGIFDIIVKGIKKIFEFIIKSIKFLVSTISKIFKGLLNMLKKLFKKPNKSGGGSGGSGSLGSLLSPKEIKKKTEDKIEKELKDNKNKKDKKSDPIEILNADLDDVWKELNKQRGILLQTLPKFKYAFINDKTINDSDLVFTTNYLNMIDEFMNEVYLKNILAAMNSEGSTLYSEISKKTDLFVEFIHYTKHTMESIVNLSKKPYEGANRVVDLIDSVISDFYKGYSRMVEYSLSDIEDFASEKVNMKKINERLKNSDAVKNYMPENSKVTHVPYYVGITDVTFNKFLYYIFTLDKGDSIDTLENIVSDATSGDDFKYIVDNRDVTIKVTSSFLKKDIDYQKKAFISLINKLVGNMANITKLSRLSHHVYGENNPTVDGVYMEKLNNILKVDNKLKLQSNENGFITFDILGLVNNVNTIDEYNNFAQTMYNNMVAIYESIDNGTNKIHKNLIEYVDSLDKNKDLNNNLLRAKDTITDIDKLITSLYSDPKSKKGNMITSKLDGIYKFYDVLNKSIVTGVKAIADIANIQNDLNNIEKLLTTISNIANLTTKYNIISNKIKKLKGE